MDRKSITLLILSFFAQISYTQAPMPADMPSEKELMDALLQGFTPEQQEEILAEAKRIQADLDALPPEERARREQEMLEEADRMFQSLMEELPMPEEVQAPVPPVEKVKPAPAVEKKKTPEKPKENPLKKDIDKIENALDSLVESLNSISLKAQSLPRVSEDIDFEAAWPEKEIGFVYARGLFKSTKNLPKVLSNLAQKENLMLAKNIINLDNILKEKDSSLQIPDTAKLKTSWDKKGKKVECCSEDVKKAQEKLADIIDYTNTVFESGLIAQLRELINKIEPEELKRQEKKGGSIPSNYLDKPYVGSVSSGQSAPGKKYGAGNYNYPLDFDGGYYAPQFGGGPKPAVPAQPTTLPAKPDDKSAAASKDAKVASPLKAKITDDSGKSLILFEKGLADLDQKLDATKLKDKILGLAESKPEKATEMERDLLPSLSEIKLDLSSVKKHAKKVLEKSDKNKDLLKSIYDKSKVEELKDIQSSLEKLSALVESESIQGATLEEIQSLNKQTSKLSTLLDKDKNLQDNKDINKEKIAASKKPKA